MRAPQPGFLPFRATLGTVASDVNALRWKAAAPFTGPAPLDPEREWLDFARGRGVRAEIERDPARAVAGADLVVTDTWVSMHDPQSARERRHNQLRGYQVNEALMAQAKPDALFMHCLPAHRDDEVTSAVMDGPNSVIFDEAENRLHAQKAVMRWCLGV